MSRFNRQCPIGRVGASLVLIFFVNSASSQPQTIYPAIYDGFDYAEGGRGGDFDSERFRRGEDFSGSVFGRNDWYTGRDTVYTRAWRRYNWDDLPLTCTNCGIIGLNADRIELFVDAGGRTGPEGTIRLPGLSSGFLTGDGTYAARVRLASPPVAGNFIQAFWTGGTDIVMIEQEDHWLGYQSETDIEAFSPAYKRSRLPDLSVANYLGKRYERTSSGFQVIETVSDGGHGIESGDLQCVERRSGGQDREIRCLDVLFDRDWIFIMRIVGSAYVEYWMITPHRPIYEIGRVSTSPSGALRVGPLRSERFVPDRDVKAIFGLYSDSAPTILPSRLSMEVDWIYYSPAHLGYDEIIAQVAHWKGIHPRVNTLDIAFQDVTSQTPFWAEIQGPVNVSKGVVSEWILDLRPLGTTYIVDEFEYVTHRCRNGRITTTSSAIPINQLQLRTWLRQSDDGMTISAAITNRWSGATERTQLRVTTDADCGF